MCSGLRPTAPLKQKSVRKILLYAGIWIAPRLFMPFLCECKLLVSPFRQELLPTVFSMTEAAVIVWLCMSLLFRFRISTADRTWWLPRVRLSYSLYTDRISIVDSIAGKMFRLISSGTMPNGLPENDDMHDSMSLMSSLSLLFTKNPPKQGKSKISPGKLVCIERYHHGGYSEQGLGARVGGRPYFMAWIHLRWSRTQSPAD